MKGIRWAVLMLVVAGFSAAFIGWKKAQDWRARTDALRAELQSLREHNAAVAEAESRQHEQELQQLRTAAQEVQKLRNEVSQLRAASKEVDKLRAENQRLLTLMANSTGSATVTPAPAPAQTADHFARENWAFSGYTTPEAALVSAIWAMREGTPGTYLESLSPEEQVRMAKVWENKSEAEIAAKHRQDVAAITGMRILERQNVSPDQVLLSVYVEGARRMETVSMDRVGHEWKFGGFKRNVTK